MFDDFCMTCFVVDTCMIYHVSLVRWFEKQRTTEERHLVYEHRGIMGYTYIIMNIYIYKNRVMIWLLSIYDSTKKTIPRAPPVDRGEARASRGTTMRTVETRCKSILGSSLEKTGE